MLEISETRRKWWVLAAMVTSLSLVFIDQTAVSVALPQIQHELGTSSVMLQWIINAYLLTLAALIIFGGKLGDRIGHRQTFLLGVIIFIIASVSCGFAPTGLWVVLSRVVQGIGGSLMIPAAVPVLFGIFAPEERGKAMGIYIGISSVFLALGTPLGGMLIEWLSWRWVFWINFPIALLSIVLTLIAVPKSEQLHPEEHLDWWGFILSGISMVCLVWGFMESATRGWLSAMVLSLLLIGFLSLVVFIRREKHVTNPFVELALFKTGTFPYATAILILIQSIFGVFIFWTIFILNVLDYSPFITGLLLLPITLPITFMAPIGGHLRDRYGAKPPLCVGVVLVTLSLFWVGLTAPLQLYIWLFPGFLLLGLATPLVMASCMASAINAVVPQKRGMATGVLGAARQLGGSIGITFAGTLITVLNRQQLEHFLNRASGGLATLHESQIDGLLAKSPVALQAIAKLSPIEVALVHKAALDAYTFAFSCTMLAVAGLGILAVLIALRFPATPK
ncbi:MAG: DHA2 family efflux MFS transporter permease subunit [Gammaproteobacteria bacterium]